MDAANRKPKAERLGRWWGRLWHGYVRGERRIAVILKGMGLPAVITAASLWAMRLGLLAGLACATFWPMLLVIGVIAIASALQDVESHERREPNGAKDIRGSGSTTRTNGVTTWGTRTSREAGYFARV